MKKLAIITTHPIQYNAPLFRMLHERGKIDLKVFYTWSQSSSGSKYDPGFKQSVQWDIPLLDGYPYSFVQNISGAPGSHHYKGIDNPLLIQEIQAWGADAVLIYGWNFKSHLKAMRFFYNKIPVLFRGDSTLLDEAPGLKQMMRRWFLKYVYSFADIALYAGKANKAYFLKHGLNEEQLHFMPHATDNDRFAGNDNTVWDAAGLRSKLNIPQGRMVFLFAGKLELKKRPGFLAKIFSAIGDEESYLLIAGSGELEDVLRSLYGNKGNIRFLGFQNQLQMPALYGACDVCVLPSSEGETWGLVLNEAMAAGKAVIASEACGASYDLIMHGENGFVFKKNDAAGLKKCLMYFTENKEAAARMGRRSAGIIKGYNYIEDCTAIENALTETLTRTLHAV